ncbi:sensor histidine kinase [Streptosporangiaceae bacterium NEAU-GS5]|nr:sensor histidine kinase [Streptosporangiaceae bacterium NEAU-GS5]
MKTSRRSSGRFALRNWRVPTRLTALILAPTVVGVLLAGTRVVASLDSISGYQRTHDAAEFSGRIRGLAQELGLERDTKVWVDKLGALDTQGRLKSLRDQKKKALDAQKKVVDGLLPAVSEDATSIDSAYGVRASDDARQVVVQLDRLSDSHAADAARLAGREVRNISVDYTAVIDGLLRLHDELSQISDDPEVVGLSRALGALARAKEEASQQRGQLLGELLEPQRSQSFTSDDLQTFLGSWSRQKSDYNSFVAEGGPENGRLLSGVITTQDYAANESIKAWAVALGTRNNALRPLSGRFAFSETWFTGSSDIIDSGKGASFGQVEKAVATQVLGRAADLESAERRNAIVAGALILALLILVLATTVLIARSMVRPLRRLRAEALDIAGLRLPEVVQRMRESGDPDHVPDVQPIDVGSRDEIGEVAQAFDEVHRQAVRLASEESRLRAAINAMFVNLSRRTQTLVERQISLIDGLERGEQDGGRLADLFKLDHLATRMRRNSENLLVLAGHEPARKRSQPARLVDVVRASLSEVEDYERVTIRVHRNAAIAGHAANDAVHLLAELVENAIAFSPRNTNVIVSSSPIEGGAVLLAVSDTGIGMTGDELLEINRRLSDPPTVDVSVSRRMGLFVVGRLALRHGIRVQLRPGDAGGLIAMVLFPTELITNPDTSVASTPGAPALAPVNPPYGYDGAAAASTTGGYQPWNSGNGDRPSRTPSGLPTRRPAASLESTTTGSFAAFGTPPTPPTPPVDSPATGFSAFAPPPGGTPTGGFPAFDSQSFAGPPTDASGSYPAFGQPPADASGGFPGFDRTSSAQPTDVSGGFPAYGWPGNPSPQPLAPLPPANGGGAGHGNGSSGDTGSFGIPPSPLSGAFDDWNRSHDPAETGPLPRVTDSALERGDEYLPIFASVESAWFRRPPQPGPQTPPAGQPPVGPLDAGAPPVSGHTPQSSYSPYAQPAQEPAAASSGSVWESAADTGWQAAQAAREPAMGGITSAGLPKRTPKANLVPGSVNNPAPAAAPRPPVSADVVRNRLSSFQQGIRRGRAEAAGGGNEGSGNEEEGS